MADTEVPTTTTEPESTPAPETGSDPFSIDESRFASLSPEQRAAIDPVLEELREKAKAEIERTGKSYEEKYKPHLDKSSALDELVKDNRFVQWWKGLQSAATDANPDGAGAIKGSKPQDFASPEEWQKAVMDAANGDNRAMQTLMARSFTMMSTPVIQRIEAGQRELQTTLEMRDLFERHNDAKELDAIGRNGNDPNDRSESLLESCLNWAAENGRPLEEGYQRARKWAESLRVGAQQKALGIVQEKKLSTTSGPSTARPGVQVMEVADTEELMNKSMEWAADNPGKPLPKFVIRQTATPTGSSRWTQRS
jgi:hypothetical protein